MRESPTENRLIYQWLALLERHGIYNVDNRHQCHRAPDRAIVQPFAWAPHFYGCLRCGRYHLCRLRVAECEVVAADDGQLTCVHSWRLVKDPLSMMAEGSHAQKQLLAESETVTKTSTLRGTFRSQRAVGAKRGAYSNGTMPSVDPHSVRDWSDEWVPEKESKHTTIESSDVQNALVHSKNEHPAEAYWREYYSFLGHTDVDRIPNLNPSPTVPKRAAPKRALWTWDVETRDAVTHTLHEHVTRVLRLCAKRRGTKLSRQAPQLVQLLVQQLRTPFHNLLLLVQNAQSTREQRVIPTQLVGALLYRLCTPFVARDLSDRPISVWRPPQWLVKAKDCVPAPQTSQQKLLATALEEYRLHTFWMRDFVQNHTL